MMLAARRSERSARFEGHGVAAMEGRALTTWANARGSSC
jgi:hypothetical protein